MIPYYVLLISPLILSVFVKDRKKYRNIMCVILFFFLALRGESVGGDLVNYRVYYNRFYNLSLFECFKYVRWEPGFILYNKIIADISHGSFRAFMVVSALFYSILISQTIYRVSKAQWYSWYALLGLGFIIYPVSGIRASLAMVIGIFAISYLFSNGGKSELSLDDCNQLNSCGNVDKKSIIRYVILITAAVMFHYTAAIYYVVVPAVLAKKNAKYYMTIILSAAILFVFGNQIVFFLAARFYQSALGQINSSGGGALLFLIFAFVMAGHFLVKKDYRTQAYSIMLCILELALLSQIITLKYALWARLTEFLYLIIIFFPIEFMGAFTKRSRCIVYGILMLFILYMYSNLLNADVCEMVPYVTAFYE